MFPWRTISGEEASAFYAAGTAQYHINADIMYGLRKYVQATGDEAFLRDCGAEMLVETARLWLDLGFHADAKEGKFCINSVTGPDEYNTVVNNNAYTNLMARENLRYAAQTVESLARHTRNLYGALVDKTALAASEAEEWIRAADSMYVPYDEKLKIVPQDDSFLDREPWDFRNTPPDHYPLLLFYHPPMPACSKVAPASRASMARSTPRSSLPRWPLEGTAGGSRMRLQSSRRSEGRPG